MLPKRGKSAAPTRCLVWMTVVVVVLAALGATAGDAAGGTPVRAESTVDPIGSEVSANWAGYVATGPGSTYTTASPTMSYSDVTGEWVEPRATCTGAPTSVALWVGLGGYSVNSQELEQAGTSADCDAGGRPDYYAWYELVPADAIVVRLKIDPGDLVTSSVVVNGDDVLVQVIDRSRGTRFTHRLTMHNPDTSSAEWIVEAPTECTTASDCEQVALTNFGQVTFARTFAIGNAVPGTIESPAWMATAITLVPTTHRVFGAANDAAVGADNAGAEPLNANVAGTGFSVSWQADAAADDQTTGASGT